MKAQKFISMLCISAALISFTACADTNRSDESRTETNTTSERSEKDDVSSGGKTTSDTTFGEQATLFENDVSEYSAGSVGELTEAAVKDTENTVAALEKEYAELIADIDTYEKYLESVDRIWAFYDKISKTNDALYVRMYEYSLAYAETAVEAGVSDEELDMLCDGMRDVADKIYGGIYEGILSDMFDDIYEGALDEADGVAYLDWADVCNDEIDRWDVASTDAFEAYSEFCSDVHDLCVDIKHAMQENDAKTATKKIEKLREKVDKVKASG